MRQTLDVVQIHIFVSIAALNDMCNKIRYFVHLAIFQYAMVFLQINMWDTSNVSSESYYVFTHAVRNLNTWCPIMCS